MVLILLKNTYIVKKIRENMSKLLNDLLNLQILENLCSSTGVEVNISALSKLHGKTRQTIKSRVDELFDNEIINRPIMPFLLLHNEYPLFVVVKADLPRTPAINEFFKTDPHIFAAFYVRDGEYNTLMIEYHRDVYSYGNWRDKILLEKKIPPREERVPADSQFFSNKHIIKYQPHSSIINMEKKYLNGEKLEINGYTVNKLSFQILKNLMMGEGMRINENLLSDKLGVNRKTIERRIADLQREKILGKPVCRFPKLFAPSNQILIFCLMEIKKSLGKVINAIKLDPYVPLAIDANIGRYKLLLFKTFFNFEEEFEWEANYDKRFPGCIGGIKKIFLLPSMAASIDQQKVSLGIIREKIEALHGRELMVSVR